jgi:hypothetical protein
MVLPHMSVEGFRFGPANSTDVALPQLCVHLTTMLAMPMLLNHSTVLLTKEKEKNDLLKVNLCAEHLCTAFKIAFERRPGRWLSALGHRSMR